MGRKPGLIYYSSIEIDRFTLLAAPGSDEYEKYFYFYLNGIQGGALS